METTPPPAPPREPSPSGPSSSSSELFSLASVPSYIALVGAFSIALALSRQLGFFYQIDLRLLALFSVEDILRNSLSFVPFTLLMWAIGIAVRGLDVSLPGSRVLERLADVKSPSVDLKIGATFIVIWVLLFENWPLMVALQIFFFFGATVALLRRRGMLDRQVQFEAALGIYLIVNAFVAGASEGRAALSTSARNYELTLSDGRVLNVNLLRATTDQFVIVEQPNEVWAVPRSEVKLLKRKSVSGGPIISLPALWQWDGNGLVSEESAPRR